MLSDIYSELFLSEKQLALIESKCETMEVKKGDILLSAGDIVVHQYFVESGCLRAFHIDSSSKEHTLQFAVKDWWISDYTAFFTGGEAIMSIECIQDAKLFKISRADIESLYREIPALETFFRKKMEKAFASFQMRILSSLSQSAKARYSSFIATYPNIEQSVKNYHIASYLGITTESLSRVRKEIAQG